MAIGRFLVGVTTLSLVACSSNSSTPHDGTTGDAGGLLVVPKAPDAGQDAGSDVATVDLDATADHRAPGCTYPSGPYGVEVGSVLSPTLSWQGYAPNATTSTTLKVTDLYDCDGSKGVNAVVFLSSAQWCVACQQEAEFIPSWIGSTSPIAGDWNALGVQVVTLLIQTNQDEPATLATAEQWRTENDVTGIWVVADPATTFPSDTLPHDLLVDPRTMKVVDDLDNDSYDAAPPASDPTGEAPDPAIASLAKQNQTEQ